MSEVGPGYDKPTMNAVVGPCDPGPRSELKPPGPAPLRCDFVPPNPIRMSQYQPFPHLSIAPPVVIRARNVDQNPFGKSEVGTGYKPFMTEVPIGYALKAP